MAEGGPEGGAGQAANCGALCVNAGAETDPLLRREMVFEDRQKSGGSRAQVSHGACVDSAVEADVLCGGSGDEQAAGALCQISMPVAQYGFQQARGQIPAHEVAADGHGAGQQVWGQKRW